MSDQRGAQQKQFGGMSRRVFVGAGAATGVAVFFRLGSGLKTVDAKDSVPKDVKIVKFSNEGKPEETVMVQPIVKTDAEWRAQLSPGAYQITRQAGTERAFTGPFQTVHDKGIFTCVCCDTALFNADTKFDSGTGWPSFWKPIAKENVHEITDMSLGERRVAVSCRRCEAHLGHVFDDGPRPTGLRYCMNGLALQFVKAS